jgi:similar to stage IV sporulation protein
MFLKIIFSYLLGYLRITVEGYYIERFINICKGKKITVWNLKRNKDICLFLNVRIGEYKELRNVAKKTKCKIKIKSKRGLPFILHKYKKRKLFLILLILVVFSIWLSSNFVWNVDIEEENGNEPENLRQDLENIGLKIGNIKSKIDTKAIINKIRLERKDIAWMGIEFKGTNAIVKIVKSDEKPEIIDEKEYCSIASNKAGVITKINAQSGTANVKVGDTIKEGDILIKGWMEGKFTGIRYVHAKGDIEAKVWHTKNKKVLYNTTEKKETGVIENKYEIKIYNFKINLYKKLSKFKIYDTIETENKIKIFSDFYLPISVIKKVNKELNEEQKKYTLEEAKNKGIEDLQKELDNEIEDKNSIVNKNINTYERRRWN